MLKLLILQSLPGVDRMPELVDPGNTLETCGIVMRHLTKKFIENVRQFATDPDILAAGPPLNL